MKKLPKWAIERSAGLLSRTTGQKFSTGDIVKVKVTAKNRSHFAIPGGVAVVEYSYKDRYGHYSGYAEPLYSLAYGKNGSSAWYLESELTLIRKGARS